MGQVPTHRAVPIGIVGDGLVARHLIHYFELLGVCTQQWSRRGVPVSPPDALRSCDTILLLIRDGAIAPFVHAWPVLRDKRLVHCAGGLSLATAQAAHPLMTFGRDLYDLETYRRIPFVVDAEGAPFSELFPFLDNPSFAIRRDDRPFYHALCVMAGNFSTLLWQKLFDDLESRLGIPPSAAYPYLTRLAINLQADAGRALTGPLTRGDVETVEANLAALRGDRFHGIYQSFVRSYEGRS